jgi:hypothetical protein
MFVDCLDGNINKIAQKVAGTWDRIIYADLIAKDNNKVLMLS